MKTFTVFALLAVAAYANIVDPPADTPVIVDEPKTIEKRQVETDPKTENEPDVHIIITDREPKREKRDTDEDDDDSSSSQDREQVVIVNPDTFDGPLPLEPVIIERPIEKRQVETDPKAEVKPVEEPDVEIVKRQAETDHKAEIEPHMHIEILDSEPKREKRDTDEDDDDFSSSRDREQVIDVNGTPVILVPATGFQPENPEQTVFVQKRQAETDPKAEIKPVDETEVHHVIKRQVEPPVQEQPTPKPLIHIEIVDDEPKRVKRDTDDDDDDSSSSEEPVRAVDVNGNPIPVIITAESDPLRNPQKRHVEGGAPANATRTRRYIEHEHDENPYPDCICNQKHPRLPLYTKLHAHCKYPGGKPRPPCNTCGHPHPHPPCNTCGHGHCPKAPCHGHGSGSVYHHHHVHVVPHAPVHVHHDVHHHFVPKRPHYRKPCDRSHQYDDDHHYGHDEHDYKH